MITLFIRAILLYFVLFVLLRLMGKRQLSELQPFEFVVTLLIADLAETPMSNTGVPLLYGLVPILALFLTQQVLSLLAFKSGTMRNLISGKPSIVITDGRICEGELKRMQYTVGDLIEQMRTQGYTLGDVAYAILETDGELSVIPYAHKRPATPEDLKLQVDKATLPRAIVLDGMVQKVELTAAGYNEQWLEKRLSELKLTLKRVLFAGIIENQLMVQAKNSDQMVMRPLHSGGGANAS